MRGGHIDEHCHIERSSIPSPNTTLRCDEILHFLQNDMVFMVSDEILHFLQNDMVFIGDCLHPNF